MDGHFINGTHINRFNDRINFHIAEQREFFLHFLIDRMLCPANQDFRLYSCLKQGFYRVLCGFGLQFSGSPQKRDIGKMYDDTIVIAFLVFQLTQGFDIGQRLNIANSSSYFGDDDIIQAGFGERGIEGKISAIKYVRENNIPFFGICLGMQCAVIEWARDVLGLSNAHTTEIDTKTQNPVIDLMEQQKDVSTKGGTMRLGAYPCELAKDSLAFNIYGQNVIMERHRHRYEFNNRYKDDYEKSGMTCSGINPVSKLVEIIEIKNHPFFIGTQFHPELKSTVDAPHPLFVRFVGATLANKIGSNKTTERKVVETV